MSQVLTAMFNETLQVQVGEAVSAPHLFTQAVEMASMRFNSSASTAPRLASCQSQFGASSSQDILPLCIVVQQLFITEFMIHINCSRPGVGRHCASGHNHDDGDDDGELFQHLSVC